ncbi:MAG TPA: hypothetical protein VFQ61_26425, partial [Polyangiaceae bacterium]|nr:hypothetical protein [Polyangiaceae bacterium]
SDRSYDQALAAYRDRRYAEAEKRFAEVAERGEENAASAALYSALATRARAGCSAAAPRFDAVHQKYPDAGAGREAAWQSAGCYRTLGDFEKARRQYEGLLGLPGYADRAQAALGSLGDTENSELAARRAAAAAAAKPAGESPAKAAGAATRPAAPVDEASEGRAKGSH